MKDRLEWNKGLPFSLQGTLVGVGLPMKYCGQKEIGCIYN